MHVNYTNFFFTSSTASWLCPGMDSICFPPNACALNPTTGQRYCCDAGNYTNVCWKDASVCQADGSSITCGGSDAADQFCCLAKEELCTKNEGQTNICWGSLPDILANISYTRLNDTFSSLSSARPAATYFTFDPSTLVEIPSSSSAPSPSSDGNTSLSRQSTALVSASAVPSTTSPTSDGNTSLSRQPNASVSALAIPSATSSMVPSRGHPLPGGAKPAIILGAIIGIAILAISTFVVGKKVGHRSGKRTEASNDLEVDITAKCELPVTSAVISEIQSKTIAPELAGDATRLELPS